MATTSGKQDKVVKFYHKADGENISVPQYDKLGNPHPGLAINEMRFEAGKTYYCAPDVAQEARRILGVFDDQTFSLLLGKVNRRALAQLRQVDFESIMD